MASFFNVGTNPFSTPVGQRIEQATDGSLTSENWALNMEICDMINESSDSARDAMKAIRKRLQQSAGKNNQVIMYTLTVLETCVKNCGKAFHVLVAQKDFIQDLIKLIGPKNDPPVLVQEKVLSLIKIWSDAFKNQSDLSGVTHMYCELKNKGIEFPETNMENMAPIYTPQRSVSATQSVSHITKKQGISPIHAVISGAGVGNLTSNSAQLTGEQIGKLQSELEIVNMNMSILAEMLSELKPGEEAPDDYQLLIDLTATCREMQARIVNLIGRITDDELTAELLRINDELNNLFLRQQRYEKNRSSKTQVTSPSAVLGAALGVPTNASVNLIDSHKGVDEIHTEFRKLSVTGSSMYRNTDEFDMLAHSRTINGSTNADLLRHIPPLESTTSQLDPLFKNAGNNVPAVSKPVKANEIDEMEAWLGNSKGIESEETVTSSEFDKFLEERAAAADHLPNLNVIGNNDTYQHSQQQTMDKNKNKNTDDLLLL